MISLCSTLPPTLRKEVPMRMSKYKVSLCETEGVEESPKVHEFEIPEAFSEEDAYHQALKLLRDKGITSDVMWDAEVVS